MKTLFIGLPAFGGMNCTGMTQSLIKLQRRMLQRHIAVDLRIVSNCASPPAARGYPMTAFLDDSNAEYYLSLDADVEFEPDQIERLLDSGLEVCAATYGTKKEPSRLIQNYVSRPAETRNGFVEMKDLGLGCVLASREALERLQEHYPMRVQHNGTWIVKWFFPFADGANYLCDAGAFWWHWRQIGGRVWVDLASDITHWGTHRFRATFPRQDAPPPDKALSSQSYQLSKQEWSIDVGT